MKKIETVTIVLARGQIPSACRPAVNKLDDGGETWKSADEFTWNLDDDPALIAQLPDGAEVVKHTTIDNTPKSGFYAGWGDGQVTYWREVKDKEPKLKSISPSFDDDGGSRHAWIARGYFSLDEMVEAANKQCGANLYIFDGGPGARFSHGPWSYCRGSRTVLIYTTALDI